MTRYTLGILLSSHLELYFPKCTDEKSAIIIAPKIKGILLIINASENRPVVANKMYPINKLAAPQITLIRGDDKPCPGGLANGY